MLLACGVFSLCAIPGTLARFSTTLTNKDKPIVRAGIFRVLANGDVMGEGTKIDLGSGGVIAPGSEGSLELRFANYSEVNVKIFVEKIQITCKDARGKQSSDQPNIKFYLGADELKTEKNSTDPNSLILMKKNEGEGQKVNIGWKWVPSGDDNQVPGGGSVTVELTIKADQVQ